MEEYIQISKINDFLYCPRSVYLHSIYENFHEDVYHEAPQKIGRLNHENIDKGRYSTAKRFLQGLPVYSRKYRVMGNIDIYDSKKKELIERKTKVKRIYRGYKYQLYAQYFSMKEMGYEVERLLIHSLTDNKRYEIPLPGKMEERWFEHDIERMRAFDILRDDPHKDGEACERCQASIYRHLDTTKQ